MSVSDWFSSFRKKQQPSGGEPETIHIYASDTSISVVMITLLCVEPAHIDEIISVTKAKFLKRHRIVFITDSLDFMQFRRQGVMFEYLPPREEQRKHADVMPWQSYLNGRWDLLLEKWKPIHVLAYGQNVETYLASVAGRAEAAPDEQF